MDGGWVGGEDHRMTMLIWDTNPARTVTAWKTWRATMVCDRRAGGSHAVICWTRSKGKQEKKEASLFDRTESVFLSGFRVRKDPRRSNFIAELAFLTHPKPWLEVCSQPYNIIFRGRDCFSSRTKEPLMTPINQCNSHLYLFITFHTQYVIHYTSH